MIANSPSSWICKWWFWALTGFAAGCFVVFRFFARRGSKTADTAANEIQALLRNRKKAYRRAHHQMRERVNKLEEIKAIKDDRERLRRLAEFAGGKA